VATLRKALDPSAKTLGDIAPFDVVAAHALYRQLLEPVSTGWRSAESLFVVADGPLGQLPFALLVTQPATLGPERDALFSTYRPLPWLIRTHAITALPTAASLATLRGLPPGDPDRRPFVAFGDPWFSEEQARRAMERERRTAAVVDPGAAHLAEPAHRAQESAGN
jgi:hypothetical protein